MIIGKTNVETWVRFNKTPYWRIKRSESEQHQIATSGIDEENLALEESIRRLKEAFQILSPGNYFIEAWLTKGQTKSWNRDHFQILPNENDYVGFTQLQNTMQQSQPAVDVAGEVARGIEKYKADVELQELRRKCAELEKENKELQNSFESKVGRIWDRVEPFMGMILNVKEPAGVAVGSVQADEAQKRLEKAFEVWQENEPEVLTMVEKIAQMSKNDKTTYQMARGFLTGK